MPGHGSSSAYRLDDGLAVGFGVGAGVAVVAGGRRGWATRSGSASGVGLATGVGLGVGAAVGAAVRSRRRRAGVVAVGAAVDLAAGPRRSGRPVRPRSGSSPPLATTNATDRRKAPIRARTDPAIAGVTIRAAGTGRAAWPRSSRAAQVARAVDVSAGQADELLLAERLGHRSAEGRASVRRSGASTGVPRRRHRRSSGGTGRSAGSPRPRRAGAATTGVSARPRGRPGIVHPDGIGGCVGRRRIVLHARSSLAPGAANGAESSTFRALPWRSAAVLGSGA